MRLELESDVLEGVLAHEHVDGPVGPDQEKACRLPAPCEQREEIDRRRVAPVQIFEHENQGRFCRQHFDRLRQLAEHSVTRGPQDLSLERVAVGTLEKPRHLREPRGRVLAQERNQPGATPLRAEAAQSIEHGSIGLGRPVCLDTLAVRDPHTRIDAHTLEKGLDDPGLADSRLPRHEDDLASAAPRRFDPSLEPIECGLAADEVGRGSVSGASGLAEPGRRLGRSISLRPGIGLGDAGDETIAAAVNRRDEARRVDTVAEGLPDLAHADLEDRIAHNRPRPHVIEQDMLRDELTVALDQTLQHGKRLRRQANGLRPPPETFIGRIQQKWSEADLP